MRIALRLVAVIFVASLPACTISSQTPPPSFVWDDTPATARTAERMSKQVSVAWEQRKLVDAIEELRRATGASIYVNWAALEAAGIEQDWPISLTIADVPAHVALRLLLGQTFAGLELESAGFGISDGIVMISTQRDLDDVTVIRSHQSRCNPQRVA